MSHAAGRRTDLYGPESSGQSSLGEHTGAFVHDRQWLPNVIADGRSVSTADTGDSIDKHEQFLADAHAKLAALPGVQLTGPAPSQVPSTRARRREATRVHAAQAAGPSVQRAAQSGALVPADPPTGAPALHVVVDIKQTVAYHARSVGIGLVAAVLWELTASATVGETGRGCLKATNPGLTTANTISTHTCHLPLS